MQMHYAVGGCKLEDDPMDMIFVDSSNVDQIGYDEAASEVHVIFKSGGHYVYSDVTPEVWNQFQNSEDSGQSIRLPNSSIPIRSIFLRWLRSR